MIVRLFGRDWEIRTDIDAFSALGSQGGFTATMLLRVVESLVDEWERTAWRRLWREANIDDESILAVMTKVIEAVANRPLPVIIRLGYWAFDDSFRRDLRGVSLLSGGTDPESLRIDQYLDVAWAHLNSLAGGLDSPHKYRQDLSDIVLHGKTKKPEKGAKKSKDAPPTVGRVSASQLEAMKALQARIKPKSPVE